MRTRLEQCQTSDYKRLQEIVRQEYEYKFLQAEKTAKYRLEQAQHTYAEEIDEQRKQIQTEYEQKL